MANPEEDFFVEDRPFDDEILQSVARIANSVAALSPRPPRSERLVKTAAVEKEPSVSERAAAVSEKAGDFLAGLDGILAGSVSL